MGSMNYLLNRIFLIHTIVMETNAKQVDKIGVDTSHDIIVEVSVPIVKKRILLEIFIVLNVIHCTFYITLMMLYTF
jgi:hypothetical protein